MPSALFVCRCRRAFVVHLGTIKPPHGKCPCCGKLCKPSKLKIAIVLPTRKARNVTTLAKLPVSVGRIDEPCGDSRKDRKREDEHRRARAKGAGRGR